MRVATTDLPQTFVRVAGTACPDGESRGKARKSDQR